MWMGLFLYFFFIKSAYGVPNSVDQSWVNPFVQDSLRVHDHFQSSYKLMNEIYTSNGQTFYIRRLPGHEAVSIEDSEGKMVPDSQLPRMMIRIANGGGGQTGLVAALARAYLNEYKQKFTTQNFGIAWRATHTQGSLTSLEKRWADIAIVYDEGREVQALIGTAKKPPFARRLKHVWMEHFVLVGPRNNPARIQNSMNFNEAIDQIMIAPSAYWLTRDDHSGIHEFESQRVLNRVNQKRVRLGLSQISL